MEVLQLKDCDLDDNNKTHRELNRAHTTNPSSTIILKSGLLHKKGNGIIGQYKKRLFELKINGHLDYFELKSNGEKKYKKGTIILTPNTRIEKRSGGTRRNAKFIIHNKKRSWYLWCNNNNKISSKNTSKSNTNKLKPSLNIYSYNSSTTKSPKSRTNPVNKTLYKNSFRFTKSTVKSTGNTGNTIIYISKKKKKKKKKKLSPNRSITSKKSVPYTSLSSISNTLTVTDNSKGNTCNVSTDYTRSPSLLSPPTDTDAGSGPTRQAKLSSLSSNGSIDDDVDVDDDDDNDIDSDDEIIDGQQESQEWCDILINLIETQKDVALKKIQQANDADNKDIKCWTVIQRPRSNSCPLGSNKDNDLDNHVIWTLKEGYMMKKGDINNPTSSYKRLYFILRINAKLDFYLTSSKKDKKGTIDILNSCINIEKRKGTAKRDCKFILFARRTNYYFWLKDNKKLANEWYHLLKTILADKLKKRKESMDIINTKTNDFQQELKQINDNDDDDDDGFIPQLFAPDNYITILFPNDIITPINSNSNSESDDDKKQDGIQTSVISPINSGSDNDKQHADLALISMDNILCNNKNTNIIMSSIKSIRNWIPMSYRCYDWELLYSSQIDGYSMLTFYEKCSDLGPTILLVSDCYGCVFGVFLSCSITLNDQNNFIGNGDCFVFTLYPLRNKYLWSGKNRFFINCKKNTLTFGGGNDGHAALVLTENFEYGISQKSQTFNNQILSKNIDFKPCVIEVWTFKNYW